MFPLPWSALVLSVITSGAIVSVIYLLSKTGVSKMELPWPKELGFVLLFGIGTWVQGSHVRQQNARASTIALIAGFFLAIIVIILLEVKGSEDGS